jgi:glycosyltransferase involved in cell wall biosynthesis
VRPGRIHAVPLGVDHSVFSPKPIPPGFRRRYQLEDQSRVILYVGSENPRKNLPRLIRAIAVIHKLFPDVRLVKIGTPEYVPQAQQLRHQVKTLGLEDIVYFVDHVSDEDLALFYNIADLFVFPSIYEGFGLPPLEAMACGTPVVCSHAASLPEVVGDAAITFDPYDTAAIAGAMRRVLEDSELAAELRQKGIARASQFTWERTARETIAVYQKVLELQAA